MGEVEGGGQVIPPAQQGHSTLAARTASVRHEPAWPEGASAEAELASLLPTLTTTTREGEAMLRQVDSTESHRAPSPLIRHGSHVSRS